MLVAVPHYDKKPPRVQRLARIPQSPPAHDRRKFRNVQR